MPVPGSASKFRVGLFASVALALAVLFGIDWPRQPAAPMLTPLVIKSVTPVSAIPGVKRMPRFSRDGQLLVFDMQQGSLADRDVWVVDLPTWSARQITRGPAIEQHADWTLDGSALVYVRTEAGHCDLIRKALATGVEHIIRPCRYGTFVRPRVSPDGAFIVYSDLVENGTQAVVYEADLRTGEQRQLTSPDPSWFDLYPDYTPDGSQILFGRATLAAVRDLYLLDRASGETRKLHHEPGIITDATMESAERFLFATQRTGQMQLIRRDMLGNEQALGLGADFIRGATLNGARTSLAFESWTIRQRIVRATLDASESVDVSASSRIDRVPALSPDQRSIAFVSTRDGYANIWLNEGGKERQVTHFRPDDPEFLRWHPSKPWLAFSITRDDGSFACMIDMSVSAPPVQCISHAGSAAPFWSADGSRFRYAAPDGAGYSVYEIDGFDDRAEPRRVIADAYFALPLNDGGHCFMRAGRDGIWCTRQGNERLVVAEHSWFNHKNWILDGDVLYALQLDGRLLKAEVTGKTAPVLLGQLPGRLHPNSGLNRAADGTFIYAALTTYESELLLAELVRD